MGLLQGGARGARLGQAAEPDGARAAAEGVRGSARRAAGARHRSRPGAADTAPVRRPSEQGTAQGQGIDCRAAMGLRFLLLGLACAAAAASFSGCFLKEEPEEGEALREGLAVKVGGIEYTVYITRELNPALPDDRGYWQGEEAKPGF